MLSDKLVKARESRGWTVGQAASRTQTVHHFSLRKLESGQTDPSKATATTMVDLLNLYYPDVMIADFVGAELARYMIAITKRPTRGRPRKDEQ